MIARIVLRLSYSRVTVKFLFFFLQIGPRLIFLGLSIFGLGFLSLLFTLVDRIFVGASLTTHVHTTHHTSQPDPPIGLVLLPLFSHFRVPYKSSGPGLMLSNEKRQGHTMLVDDVSSLRPLLYCSRCLRSSSHPKTWAAKVLLSFLAIYGI